MVCKHKPKDPRLIISTEYGRYYTFDRVQQCKKCGTRIAMKHKLAYKVLIFFVGNSIFLWMFLFFYFDDIPTLEVLFLLLMVGSLNWISGCSGYFMTWCEVKLTDQEKAKISERNTSI